MTSEVLPAIRKNGGYFHINPEETPEQIKARFQKVLEEAIAERDKVIVSLEKDVDRMLPKELYVDNVLDSISCYTTTQIAKELGITAQELNRSLCASHIQYYQSGQYMLYAEYAHMGLAKSRTKSGVKAFDLQVPIGDAERSMKLGRSILVPTSYGRSVDASSSTTSPRECGT